MVLGQTVTTRASRNQESDDIKKIENDKLEKRNNQIAREIIGLKKGRQSVEEKAREELGMIGKGETFFFVSDMEDQEPVNERQFYWRGIASWIRRVCG